jgi:hypothetical protein
MVIIPVFEKLVVGETASSCDDPRQIVADGGVIIGALGVPITNTSATFEQPVDATVPVTVYVVFTVVVAVTVVPVVALNPSAGDHE